MPFAPGGNSDGIGRLISQYLGERLGQQFLIENRPGGMGAIAAEAAKDDPIIYLFHPKWFYAFSPKLGGFTPMPDGLVRVKGLKLG